MALLVLFLCVGCESGGLLAGGGERPAVLVQDGNFEYPAAARAARTVGSVQVRFDIDADGRVRNAQVESAQPPGVFDAAAIAYVSARRYRPAQNDGVDIAVLDKRETINFAFDGPAYSTAPPTTE